MAMPSEYIRLKAKVPGNTAKSRVPRTAALVAGPVPHQQADGHDGGQPGGGADHRRHHQGRDGGRWEIQRMSPG